jgi:hypothetical protein
MKLLKGQVAARQEPVNSALCPEIPFQGFQVTCQIKLTKQHF